MVVVVVVVVAASVVVWISLAVLTVAVVVVGSVSVLLTLHPVNNIESKSKKDKILDVVFIKGPLIIIRAGYKRKSPTRVEQ